MQKSIIALNSQLNNSPFKLLMFNCLKALGLCRTKCTVVIRFLGRLRVSSFTIIWVGAIICCLCDFKEFQSFVFAKIHRAVLWDKLILSYTHQCSQLQVIWLWHNYTGFDTFANKKLKTPVYIQKAYMTIGKLILSSQIENKNTHLWIEFQCVHFLTNLSYRYKPQLTI